MYSAERSDGESISKGSPRTWKSSHHSASARCLAVQPEADTGWLQRQKGGSSAQGLPCGVPTTVLGGQAVDQCANAAKVGTG